MTFEKVYKVVKLLWWKSWKIRLHYKKCFIALFVLPLIIPALITAQIIIRGVNYSDYTEGNYSRMLPAYTKPVDLFNISFSRYSDGYCWRAPCTTNYSVLYTPENAYTRKVMQNVIKILEEKAGSGNGVMRQYNLKPMKSEHEIRQLIEDSYSSYTIRDPNLGGVSFLNSDVENGEIPTKIHYDIIVGEYVVSQNLYVYGYDYYHVANSLFMYSGYIDQKFALLQAVVDIAHLKLLIDENLNVDVNIQQFPVPGPSKSYTYFDHLAPLIALSFSLSLLFIFPVTVKRIVEEKSTRVKEYLVCCGVNPGLYWTTTFLDTFCLVALQTIALIIILSIPIGVNVYDRGLMTSYNASVSVMSSLNASVILLIFVFIFYFIQTSLFATFLTIFFENANVAASVSIVVSVLSAFYPIYSMFAQFNSFAFSAILPNCAMYWIIYAFRGRHYLGEESNGFSNLFESSRWGDSLSVGEVFTFMILSSVLYGFLTWYLTEVWPWQRGVSKPWYFPFAKHYRRHVLRRKSDLTSRTETPLIVSNVSKTYDSSKKAVLNNVSFNVEDKSLTVLLGPNGSGKSTLINIICGLSSQTEGDIFVYGNNTDDKLENAQSYLGFCPQHNTYFKYLTVRENLELIFTLKREIRERIDGYKVDEIIEMLSLQQFAHQITRNLSGGVLRRLTLAMAMVGPSDILVIDEPTESLDPVAKRSVWDILVQSRETKTILVCSHQLDEVNVIADKVAVLTYGELKCIKTTLELKKEYGMGYTLRIKKNPEVLTNEQIQYIITERTEKATNEKYSPESEELIFHIPFDECHQMPSILKELEKQQFQLGIESMSLFATTLEDVYSQIIGSEGNGNEVAIDEWKFDNSTIEEMSDPKDSIEQNKAKLVCRQLISLVSKNFFYTIQHWSLLIIYILIPLLLLLIILLATRVIVSKHAQHLLENNVSLKQDLYGKYTQSFVVSDEEEFIDAYKSTSNGVNVYKGAVSDLQDWLLKIADKDVVYYLKYYLFGGSFYEENRKINVTVWVNPSAIHAIPISLNTAMNTLIRAVTQSDTHAITVENKWSNQKSGFDREFIYQHKEIYDFMLFPICVAIYAICYSAYTIRPVVERNLGFSHLQIMTGLHPLVYWSSHFIFDLVFNFLCSTVHIFFFYILDTDGVFTRSQYYFISMFTVFFFAGFSQIPLMYCFSFLFKKSTSAYLFMALFCIVIGITLVPFTIGAANIAMYKTVKMLILAPFVAFPQALTSLHKAYVQNTICDRIGNTHSLSFCMSNFRSYVTRRICCPSLCSVNSTVWGQMQNCTSSPNPFNYESGDYTVLTLICFMIVSGLVYFALTNLIEFVIINGYASQIYSSVKTSLGLIKRDLNYEKSENDEVIAETNYVTDVVNSNRISQEAMVIQELTKQFDSLRIPNRMNLTVRKGECFGLLGGNACGKTTTFKLLTSQLKPTFGNAFINDLDTSLTSNTPKYLSLIGYCPQNDALLDSLTGLQTLNLFMNLRGISNAREMENIVQKFHLQSVLNQRVSTYSGGNRRKLSLALALIGHQTLLLLDEPTNGVDPCSRHKVWQLLKNISESFQVSMLLTSHNMQEVEALCDRIAVMSIGKVMCIGSLNELRDKYGKGFNLVVKVEREVAENEESMSNVKQLIAELFQEEKLSLRYENFGVLYYNLISNSISLSNIFEKLEEIRNECKLEDYIVSNANLEQSLLMFMKKS